ncbi:uracil-DNA glycosylase family protein [Flagellimonas allohymeniacidonis]|uniref:Uracil-DNA glycosylase family protein n=1 Tax=Flagellimonas allohymeniacidonis TaxID=2517819 RepID=A0A4Q8QCC2_9FLAO|nr:uracil-DNA glycosylase family protein [Allomuricauda hymeniacidonis]TAI46738.1 uracil-DNA glycosylase family protein [Allomuricauda hymeniacidonis]
MFLHKHPYKPFLFPEATKIIVGTLPPPRFSTGELREEDVDFCYGSCNGLLWPILDKIFGLQLKYETTNEAAQQRKNFLLKHKIGVCDIVESAEREKVDASDLGMQNAKLRNIIGYLQKYKQIDTLLFTGGNSKNGPEYFFRRHIKPFNVQLETVSNEIPRIYRFQLPETKRVIRTVSLTAPSGAANRAIGSLEYYKKAKAKNPAYTTFDFRVEQYRSFFEVS